MKNILQRGALLLIIAIVAGAGLGAAAAPLAKQALAASCPAPNISFGRYKWCGYWYSRYEDPGTFVRDAGVPGGVNTVQSFISLIAGDINSGDVHREAGARFVVLTMIGVPPPAPAQPANSPKIVTAAQYNDWVARVNTYGNIGQNGSQSWGANGRVDWYSWVHLNCGTYNTYYQPNQHDIAPYIEHSGNSNCTNPGYLDELIIFRDTAGNPIYMIRRACMNPIGTLQPLSSTPPPNYDVHPIINTSVNGGSSTMAEVGDNLSFTYVANNTGTTASVATSCQVYGNNRPGYVATPGSPTQSSSGGYSPPPTSCPPAMPVGGSHTAATESFTVATGNTTVCRSFFLSPATPAGITRGVEVCIPVANKPYTKVFGGDVMAGSGLETSLNSGICTSTSNANAAVVGWNKGSAPYAGAGAQYAVTALSNITSYASGQITGASTAVPYTLSFNNVSTNVGAGNYGGNFGSASCIKDYYALKPATTTLLSDPTNISSLGTANYSLGTNLTITGGNVNPNQRTTLYVNGDVYITGNITYAGNWSYDHMPMLRIVARGSIRIGAGVTQLDGIYIAQQSSPTSGGGIYTCATGFSQMPLSGSFYSTCNNKLTVNGAFIANSIELLRTKGSLGQASAAEASSSSNIAEVFNYSPAFWIPQPGDGDSSNNYDAITSLPPVL